jgi:hypothetical protein
MVEGDLFTKLRHSLAESGVQAVPVAYHDDSWQEAERQLLALDGALVWIDPLEGGRDRTILDALLRRVASAGVFVSAHPDTILKIGTKEVLCRTRSLGWGSDTHLYLTLEQMRRELPERLANGQARVLKQNRGNSGIGVWRVQLPACSSALAALQDAPLVPGAKTPVRVRHAKRGAVEETMPLGDFLELCRQYFAGEGRMIDQAYQERLPEGTVRCYLVRDRVVGFGRQAVNALFPAPAGALASEAPQPGPRLYHPATMPELQALKRTLEQDWLPVAQQLLGVADDQLPVIWDCDFLLGPRDKAGADTYVLCEINVSCVTPFPESAIPFMAAATAAMIQGCSPP